MSIQSPATAYSVAVTWRQYLVWRKLIWSSLATNVANPILFLFAFGFGLRRFIDTMDGVDYLAFVVPGMIAYGAVFAAAFETSIGAFTRFHQQKNWDAVLSTPVTLRELLFGEALWASCKAMLSAVCVLIVGAAWAGIPSLGGALLALPVVFLGAFCFSCCGLVATSIAKGYEFFNYYFTFWVTPMLFFCGVFFDIDRFPPVVQAICWALPMTHLLSVIRPLSIGQPLEPLWAAIHLGYLVALSAVAFAIAYRRTRRRMFD